MYRVSYTYIGTLNCDGIYPGKRIEIQFVTTWAFTAYENRLKEAHCKDVTLEMYSDGKWNYIKGARYNDR